MELRDDGAGVRSAILKGVSRVWPRTTTVTLPLVPDVVFKVAGLDPTLPLLQVQSGGFFVGSMLGCRMRQ